MFGTDFILRDLEKHSLYCACASCNTFERLVVTRTLLPVEQLCEGLYSNSSHNLSIPSNIWYLEKLFVVDDVGKHWLIWKAHARDELQPWPRGLAKVPTRAYRQQIA